MNPLQLAVVFKNYKAFDYMSKEMNTHLKLNLMAPPISYGALQIKDCHNQIWQESWALLVAINNKDIKMLQYLWSNLSNSQSSLSREIE